MSWDDASKARAESGRGVYMKWADGEDHDLVLLSEPEPVMKPDFTGKPRTIYRFRVWCAGVQSIWECSGRTFDDMLALRRKGRIDGWMLSIGRNGSGLDTRYQIMPLERVADAEMARLRALDPLTAQAATEAYEADSVEPAAFDACATVDDLKAAFATAWRAARPEQRRAVESVYRARLGVLEEACDDIPF